MKKLGIVVLLGVSLSNAAFAGRTPVDKESKLERQRRVQKSRDEKRNFQNQLLDYQSEDIDDVQFSRKAVEPSVTATESTESNDNDQSPSIDWLPKDVLKLMANTLEPADAAHFGATCRRCYECTKVPRRKIFEDKIRSMDLLNNRENQKDAITPWGKLERMLANPIAREAFQRVFPPEELSKLLSLKPGPNVHTTFLEWAGMNGLANFLDTAAEYSPNILDTRFHGGKTFAHVMASGGSNQLATLEILKKRAPHLFTATDNIGWTPALTLTRFTPSSLPLLRFYAENFPETLVTKSSVDSVFKGRTALEEISARDFSWAVTSGYPIEETNGIRQKILEIMQAWEANAKSYE